MTANNMRSTLISDEYLDNIIDTTLNEIIKLLGGVFGPKGTDIFISSARDNSLYLTRDGKQVFNSLHFDNALAEQLRSVIGQAVNTQADVIGDSTTTVGLIACYMIKEIRNYIKTTENVNRFDAKKAAKKIINMVKEEIKKSVFPLNYGSVDYKALVYTTTGDTKFINTILSNIDEIRADSIIDVQLNELVSENSFEVSGVPKIKSSIMYSKKPLKKGKDDEYHDLKNSVILFVDGSLSVFKYQTFALLSLLSIYDIENVIIYCASIDKTTNDTLRHYQSEFVANLSDAHAKALSNIIIMKLPDYMGMNRDEILDLNAIFYDDARDMNINNPLDFEHKLYHGLYKIFASEPRAAVIPNKKGTSALMDIINVEDYLIYDGDEEIISIIENTMLRMMDVQISPSVTILPKSETPAKNSRINKINEDLNKSRSTIDKIALAKRLSRFYSSKIIVKIGSDILSSAQKDTELLLDALKASQRAIENGIIKTNGLSLIYSSIDRLFNESKGYEVAFSKMLQNVVSEKLLNSIYENPSQYGKIFVKDGYHNIYMDPDTHTELYVVEPVDAILKVLDAVELAVDIAFSEVFTTKGFLNNYI